MGGKRGKIFLGMVAGAIWAMLVLWIGKTHVVLPVMTLIPTIMTAFLAPGMVLMAMIGRIAQRRFFDDESIDGGALAGAAETDRRVLANTVEQILLALCIWPAAAVILGAPGIIITLGLAFIPARLAFWIGYHLSPDLRAFGFAATFYPTVLLAFWALIGLAQQTG